MNEIKTNTSKTTINDIDLLLREQTITIDFDGGRLDVTPDMVDVRIDSKEGFNVGMENNKFIILNTELSQNLLNEGLARETISKIQNFRRHLNMQSNPCRSL